MPNPIDIHVGRRIRARRLSLGLSQEQMGDICGVTFQQFQKYERGDNRVSASRLFAIAQGLKAPVAWFFEGLGDAAESPEGDVFSGFAVTNGARDLAEAWLAISPRQRLRLRDLAVAMADPSDGSEVTKTGNSGNSSNTELTRESGMAVG